MGTVDEKLCEQKHEALKDALKRHENEQRDARERINKLELIAEKLATIIERMDREEQQRQEYTQSPAWQPEHTKYAIKYGAFIAMTIIVCLSTKEYLPDILKMFMGVVR